MNIKYKKLKDYSYESYRRGMEQYEKNSVPYWKYIKENL